jgi:hypothetical protein
MPISVVNQQEPFGLSSVSLTDYQPPILKATQNVPATSIGYTHYTRPLDPRLSHISIDTHHTRNTSQSSNLSLPASRRTCVPDGPLSLTTDRYRGAGSFSTPPSQPLSRHRRGPEGLSIDTTFSQRSYRNSSGTQWQSPLMRRNNLPASNVDADGIHTRNQGLQRAG